MNAVCICRDSKVVRIWQRLRLFWLAFGHGAAHYRYLRGQYERSRSRKHNRDQLRIGLLIDMLIETAQPPKDASILCIGCRNACEIDAFAARGYRTITGVDLFSADSRIRVMDMHALKFPDHCFDVVFASHSLEHARDVQQVVREMVRVARHGAVLAIEVPVCYETRGADLIDFENAQKIGEIFGPHGGRALASERQPVGSPRNTMGTAVVRVILRIGKHADDGAKTG